MTPTIDIQSEEDSEETDGARGVLGLALVLADVIRDVLKHQALRRMENNSLTDEECDALGNALRELDRTLEKLKDQHELHEVTDKLHQKLDGVLDGQVDSVRTEGFDNDV